MLHYYKETYITEVAAAGIEPAVLIVDKIVNRTIIYLLEFTIKCVW